MKEGQRRHSHAELQPKAGDIVKATNHTLFLEKLLGEGASADVFRALSSGETGPKVLAAKILALSSRDGKEYPQNLLQRNRLEMFQEADMLSRLAGHINILPLLLYEERQLSPEQQEIVGIDSMPIIGTMIANGGTLFERLKKQTLPEKLDSLVDIAEGLTVAHKSGIVHGDVKPENVLCHVFDHKPGEVRLLADWGTAMYEGTDPEGFIKGTFVYMAPERATGDIRRANDIYTLGTVMYKMLTHDLPYKLDTFNPYAWIEAHQKEPFIPLADLPDVHPEVPMFQSLITASTEKDPRYRPTITQMRDELKVLTEKILPDDHFSYRRGQRVERRPMQQPRTGYMARHY